MVLVHNRKFCKILETIVSHLGAMPSPQLCSSSTWWTLAIFFHQYGIKEILDFVYHLKIEQLQSSMQPFLEHTLGPLSSKFFFFMLRSFTVTAKKCKKKCNALKSSDFVYHLKIEQLQSSMQPFLERTLGSLSSNWQFCSKVRKQVSFCEATTGLPTK